jgi:hypothetical protein
MLGVHHIAMVQSHEHVRVNGGHAFRGTCGPPIRLRISHVSDSQFNMKTIAVSIDEPTLERARARVGRARSGKGRGQRGGRPRTLSQIVREALRRELDRIEREEQEQHDRLAFRAHRTKLHRQARALVSEQAKP